MVRAMSIPEVRPLTDQERRLLEWLLQHGTPQAADYLHQLPRVSVVSRCGCGCPTIDLAVGGYAASPGSATTILADGFGVSPEGVHCGIILHGREGLISELEVYPNEWERRAFSLPHIENIEL